MGNIFNEDFRDFIAAFNNHDVEYILVGGYSVILHGYTRTTGDMDLWANRKPENYSKIVEAFAEFGMAIFEMTADNFLNNNDVDVFTFGLPPVCIDLLNKVQGLDFESAFKNAFLVEIEGIQIRVISYNDLIKAKMASGRPKDTDDIQNLSE